MPGRLLGSFFNIATVVAMGTHKLFLFSDINMGKGIFEDLCFGTTLHAYLVPFSRKWSSLCRKVRVELSCSPILFGRTFDQLLGTAYFQERCVHSLMDRLRQRGRINSSQHVSEQISRLFSASLDAAMPHDELSAELADDSANDSEDLKVGEEHFLHVVGDLLYHIEKSYSE